ncbi:MAG: alkaline phosphatase family protein [Deltaproteobacteria bacterium]|nr:alkaline phosphatase family protein [Deltaproteobacteria bacterium]MBI3293975.1 alkaline phosphatase family protein [Deltaproteobacteria bacterium]
MMIFLFCSALFAEERVILVSIDGFRWDYLDRFELKNLRSVAREGVRVKKLQPVFPSVTFPNHYSIVTGLWAEHHGIVSNHFKDAQTGDVFTLSNQRAVASSHWWGGEPIWVTAEKQKVRTASMFWVGSEALIGGVRPSDFVAYDKSVPNSSRVNKVLEWLDRPLESRPRFVTLYFDVVDTAGHQEGPNSRLVEAAAAAVDSALGELFQGLKRRSLWESTVIIVVSDHGMAEVLPDHRVVFDPKGAEVLGRGPFLQIWPAGPVQKYIKVIQVPAHTRLYRKGQFPKRWHYEKSPRIAPILLIAEEGWYIELGQKKSAGVIGAHGYDNALASMQGALVARGPSLKKGVVETMPNLVIYNVLCRLLGLKPAPNDGGNPDVLLKR